MKTFKLCANLSFLFQETSNLLERYSLAKNNGFNAVECAFPYDFSVEEIKKAKEAADVKQILINVYPGDQTNGELGFAALPDKVEEFKQSLNKAITYAKALNCNKIHIMSGMTPNRTEKNEETYIRNLKYAAQVLEKENLLGLIEPINKFTLPDYFLQCFHRGLAYVKEINSPHLKLMVDVYHLQRVRGNLTYSLKELLPFTGHIQVAQVPDRGEPNTPGEIDYCYIFDLLEKLNYSDYIGLEYKPSKDTKSGLKWIAEMV